MRQQVDLHTPNQQPGGPTVWILSKGEFSEGGNVIGVYADRDLARGEFTTQALNMSFAIDDARQNDDGSIQGTSR